MMWWQVAVIAAVVVVAAALQGSIGFGLGMLVAPVVAVIDPTVLPGIVIIIAIVVTMIVAVRERSSLDLAGAGWALIGRVPGSFAGAWLVSVLPSSGLAWLVAIVVLAGVGLSVIGWSPVPTRANLITAGAASGVMGTATSIGGAPMALIWQRSEGPRLRGTMAAFFLVGSLISLALLIAFGTITAATLSLAAWLLPAALAGYALSRFTNRLLTRRRLRTAALAASAFGAIFVIVAQLL